MLGGNYVIASHHPKPWRKQINILIAYAYFYNPLRLLLALVRPKTKLYFADATWQVLGMWGLLQTLKRTSGWIWRLRFGKIRRRTAPPMNKIPMRAVDGSCASHALSGSIQSDSDEPELNLPAAALGKSTPLPVLVST